MLNVNNLIGFGVGSGYEIQILVNTTNFSLTSALTAVGWGGGPAEVRVIVASGVVVYGTGSNPGFTTSGVPSGSSITLVNSGIITGAGGKGGDAGAASAGGVGSVGLIATLPMTIDNSAGVIAGGGGGGGAGGNSRDGGAFSGGGGGGGGSGFGAGGLGATSYNLGATPGPGAAGGSLTGGAGGAGAIGGANGGGWPGTGIGDTGGTYAYDKDYPGGAGGNPGNCTSGVSNITWIATGTRYGTLA